MPKKIIKSKKIIKRKKRKTVRFSKTNNVYPIKKMVRTRRGRRKRMSGGGIQHTLLPSNLMNGWYDMMSTPKSMLMSYDGVEYSNSVYADPLKGHLI
jgi:hypothetical protein|tara:strand:+ start:1448 stop:1738 length:291 start_codon:yes stop_codon:yes gene_type:complete